MPKKKYLAQYSYGSVAKVVKYHVFEADSKKDAKNEALAKLKQIQQESSAEKFATLDALFECKSII